MRKLKFSIFGLIFVFLFLIFSFISRAAEVVLPGFIFKDSSYEAPHQDQPLLVTRIPTKEKVIALTFDDGPKPYFSEKILDILDFYKTKATFFVVGKCAEENSSIIRRMADAGHEIGNHSYSHTTLRFLKNEDITREIRTGSEVVEKITRARPRFFRTPGGRFTRRILNLAAAENLINVGWSINARDYVAANGDIPNKMPVREQIKKIVAECQNGDIILMHNGGQTTSNILPLLIKELKDKNFRLVTLGQLLKFNTGSKKNAG